MNPEGSEYVRQRRACNIFFPSGLGNWRKGEFFLVKRSVPENFQRKIFFGLVPTESLRSQDSENVYERWVQQIVDPVLVARTWVSATKWVH